MAPLGISQFIFQEFPKYTSYVWSEVFFFRNFPGIIVFEISPEISQEIPSKVFEFLQVFIDFSINCLKIVLGIFPKAPLLGFSPWIPLETFFMIFAEISLGSFKRFF